jgi:multiple sugar transport system permease protein
MSRKMQISATIGSYTALILMSVIFAIPFYWLVSTSFKTNANINIWPPQIVPHPVTMEHYKKGLEGVPFGLYLANTLLICIPTVIGTLISCSLVAYGLSRIQWKAREPIFWMLLSTMMIPYQVVMVPLFNIFTKLGWVDTYLPMIVPAFFGAPFYIFLLRQFFMTIPQGLSEAAKLDGCSEFQIYRLIMLPLAKPALATVGLFTFMGMWNEFLQPLIYLFDESRYPLTLGLQMFMGQFGSYFGRLMAMSTLFILPIIVIFFFAQKTFIQGITMTGMKQ